MDALGALQNIAQIAFALKEIYDGVTANKTKCRQLISRACGIVEIIDKKEIQTRLKGKEVPQVLLNLQEIVTECEDFVSKYGASGFVKKLISWQSIKDEFEDLNDRLSQCTQDCNLMLTVEIKEIVTTKIVEEVDDNSTRVLAEGNDVIESFEDTNESALLLWVDHQKGNNTKAIAEFSKEAPHIAIVECESTEELKSIFTNNRSLMCKSMTGRLRVVTNRARPSESDPTKFNEKAAHDVKEFLKDMGNVPMMIYTSRNDIVESLNKELGSRSPYIKATNATATLKNFALMSQVLWIWPNLDSEAESIIAHYEANGIVIEHKKTVEDAIAFLYDNPDLKCNNRFRIVMNRYMEKFVSEIRKTGYNTPVCIFTSQPNVAGTKQTFEKYGRVSVEASTAEVKNFGMMKPLAGETVTVPNIEALSLNNNYKKNNSSKINLTSSQSNLNKPDTPKVEHIRGGGNDFPCRNVTIYGFCDNEGKGCTFNHSHKKAKQAPSQIRKGIFSAFYVNCKGLQAKDSNGLSDPYVVFKNKECVTKTSTIKKTLNPEWKNRLFRITENLYSNEKINIEVWDWNAIGSDSFEGTAVLDLSTLTDKPQMVTLNLGPRPNRNDVVKGTITINASFV